MEIREELVEDPRVVRLLEAHLELMRSVSPPESIHALPVDALRDARVALYTAWEGDTLLGCGALQELDAAHGEIKAVHTARNNRRRGVRKAILRRLIHVARVRGYRRLSLETGSQPAFEAARRLYREHGFIGTRPFGDYRLDPNSVYLTRPLAADDLASEGAH